MGKLDILKKVGLGALSVLRLADPTGITEGVLKRIEGAGLISSPEAKLKMKEILLAHEIEMGKQQGQLVEAVNETMRAEAKSEHWPQYSWRPAIGFAFAIQALTLGLAFAYFIVRIALGYGFEPDSIKALSDVMGAMAPLFLAEGGILGAAATFRGIAKWQEKRGEGGLLK